MGGSDNSVTWTLADFFGFVALGGNSYFEVAGRAFYPLVRRVGLPVLRDSYPSVKVPNWNMLLLVPVAISFLLSAMVKGVLCENLEPVDRAQLLLPERETDPC